MKLLAFLVRASGWSLLPSCIAGAISGVGTVAIIAIIRAGLGRFGSDTTALAWQFIAMCGAVLLSGVVSQLLLVRFSQQAILNLRLELGRQVLAAPLRDIENIGPARLTAMLSDDVNVLANCFMVLPGLFINLAIILTCFGYLWWLSGATFLYVATFMVFGIVSYQLPNIYAWKQFGVARRLQDVLFTHFRGLTEGFKELKLHTSKRDAFLRRSLETTATEFKQRSIAGLNIYSIASTWGQLLFFLLIAFLLFLVPRFHRVDYGVVSGYVLVCLFLMAPLGTLLAMLPVFGRASVAFNNLEKLGLSLTPERVNPSQLAEPSNGNWREIQLKDVSHTYFRDGEDRPFKIGPVNLSFSPGEIVFLAGGNGSGKTTMAKILTSLYAPESGQITFNGEPVTEENREIYRNHFAAVFSDFYLFDTLSGIGLDFDEEKANQYLNELKIGNKVCVRNGAFSTTALSQGQRKRLALLISFLEDRDFYIFDEWAADQDPVFKDVFYTQVLPELKKRGKTVLAITHDEKYFDAADRLIKMDSGQILSDVHLIPAAGRVSSLPLSSNGRHASPATYSSLHDLGKVNMSSTAVAAQAISRKTQHYWKASIPVLAFTFLFVWLVGINQKPPAPAPESAPAQSFSATRALLHLNQIAQKPHPVGSNEHNRVRDYIEQQLKAMGLSPQIEEQIAVDADFSRKIGILTSAGRPQNIVAILPGTNSTKSLLVSAHYDSVSTGAGASDDGSAVAAALETIRALRVGPPLKNDAIFLFTDGEEVGLLGAAEFVENHKQVGDLGLVLNFDARGASGQDLMFETGPGNGRVVREFARVAPYPSASSLGYEIYKHLPNDTDFTEFKTSGISGLNFAFIKDYAYYHTGKDDIENADPGTLQQMGSNMLALVKHFGNEDLANLKTSDAVFFNLPGWMLVQYRIAWVKPLAVLVLVLFAAVVVPGLRNKAITSRGLIFGAAVSLLSFITALVAVTALWLLVVFLVHPAYRQIAGGNSYHANVYSAALLSLGLAVTSAIYGWALHRTSLLNLAMGAAFVWLCLLSLSAILFPGASYLFTWPLLFCLIAFLFQILLKRPVPDSEQKHSYRQLALMAIGSIPAILVVVPVLYLILLGLTLLGSGVAAAFMALLFGLLIPQFHVLYTGRRRIFPLVALAAFLFLMTLGAFISGFNDRHPRPDSLMYAFNPEKNAATWISFDNVSDAWTKQFIPDHAQQTQLSEYFPWTARKFRVANAPVVQLAPPAIDVLQDQTRDGLRTLKLRVRSQRLAPELAISSSSGDRLRSATLNGHPVGTLESMAPVLRQRNTWGFDFIGLPDQGVDLVLQMTPGPISLTFIDASYGFPDSLAQSMPLRSSSTIAHPIPINNKTYVTTTKTF